MFKFFAGLFGMDPDNPFEMLALKALFVIIGYALLLFALVMLADHYSNDDKNRRIDEYIREPSRIFAEQVTDSQKIDKETYEHYLHNLRAYDPTISVDISISSDKDARVAADSYTIEKSLAENGEYRLKYGDVLHMIVFIGEERAPVYTFQNEKAEGEK